MSTYSIKVPIISQTEIYRGAVQKVDIAAILFGYLSEQVCVYAILRGFIFRFGQPPIKLSSSCITALKSGAIKHFSVLQLFKANFVPQKSHLALEIVNRKARHEYHMLQKLEAGIMLKGTEVKSLRLGQANMSDAWCQFEHDELWLKNLHINEYEFASAFQHEAKGSRKLLLKKTELKKLQRRVDEKGLTIIPYRIYFSERGHAKCEIWLAQGKKEFDKRNTIKERDVERDLARYKNQ